MSETECINCPICGPGELRHLLSVDGWNIDSCTQCTLAMVNPRRKNSHEIYESDDYFQSEKYYYDYEGNKAAYQKGFRSKLKVLSRHCPGRGKLLDVGAAYGFFMEEAARFGFEPYGAELSKSAAACAARYGTVFQSPLADINTAHRFSAVTFIDSLEHFEDPVAGLNKAWELLEDDGVVAVMVPNIGSPFARITGKRWHLLLPEEHLFYFTPMSVQAIFRKTGFELIELRTGGYGRSISEILRVVFRGKRIAISGLENLLKKITLEVNLGDILAIGKRRSDRVHGAQL